MAKDDSIGPNGRSVSCARCDAVWFVEGTDPDMMAFEDNKTVLITAEPDIESMPDSDVTLAKATPSVGAHTLLRDKADAEKLAKRKRLISLIWAAPLLILFGAASSAILKRQTIVENHPKTASLFQSIGLGVKSNGLDIHNVASEHLLVDGEAVLRVTGEVMNLTSQAKISPLVQFGLENRSGEMLVNWFVEPGTIPAGQSIPIETDFPAPPIDSVQLRYRFAPDE